MQRLLAFLRPPAVQALLIQIAALPVSAVVIGATQFFGLDWNLLMGLALQGVLAAGATRWRGLDTWWVPIQLAFPALLALGLALSLPPAVFLVLFLIFLVLFWSTFRTRVPYYPSRLATWEAVEHLLPNLGRPLRFIDIGSGFGGLSLYLAQRQPASRFEGIEIAPMPWLVSAARARLAGEGGMFRIGDYQALDFAEYDVVFAFLSPAAMPDLWEKARREMRPGSLLLSYEFKIPGIPSEITTGADARNAHIYGWHL